MEAHAAESPSWSSGNRDFAMPRLRGPVFSTSDDELIEWLDTLVLKIREGKSVDPATLVYAQEVAAFAYRELCVEAFAQFCKMPATIQYDRSIFACRLDHITLLLGYAFGAPSSTSDSDFCRSAYNLMKSGTAPASSPWWQKLIKDTDYVITPTTVSTGQFMHISLIAIRPLSTRPSA